MATDDKQPARRRPARTLRQRLLDEGPQTPAQGTAGFTFAAHVQCFDSQRLGDIRTGLRELPDACKNGHPVHQPPGWTK